MLVRNGHATEGTASSLLIVYRDEIITPPKSHDLLPSITRDVVLSWLHSTGSRIAKRPSPLAELREARGNLARQLHPRGLRGHGLGWPAGGQRQPGTALAAHVRSVPAA